MKNRNLVVGHLSVFLAYLIFGFNIVICKDIANCGLISPMGLFCLRALGATILFWLVSLFFPKENIEKRDFVKIFCASVLGLYFTQISFLIGITLTTPLDCSIITVLSPIFTMIVAAIVLKEPISLKKAGGVTISFIGVLFLIFNSAAVVNGVTQTKPWGIVLLIMNAFSFALYLGIFRPLISKYSVVTFMKWMFLFSLVMSLPFRFKELLTLDYASIPRNYYVELGFLIFFSTFVAYFLVPIGQKYLRPTVVSLYSYLQPTIASAISIYVGMDTLTWQKIVAAVAIIVGAVFVNKSRSAIKQENSKKK